MTTRLIGSTMMTYEDGFTGQVKMTRDSASVVVPVEDLKVLLAIYLVHKLEVLQGLLRPGQTPSLKDLLQ